MSFVLLLASGMNLKFCDHRDVHLCARSRFGPPLTGARSASSSGLMTSPGAANILKEEHFVTRALSRFGEAELRTMQELGHTSW